MTCPDCKGEGMLNLVAKKLIGRYDWVYVDRPCTECKGKGYLTPEEQGKGKF